MIKIKREVKLNGDSIGEWSLDEIRMPDRDPDLLLRELEVELEPGEPSSLLDEIFDSLAGVGLRKLDISKLVRTRNH
jgi:hypothetical protein